MGFPKHSAFEGANVHTNRYDALRALAAQRPAITDNEERTTREHESVGIERWQLEDWVNELRDVVIGRRTAGFGMVAQIADEIDGYLDR